MSRTTSLSVANFGTAATLGFFRLPVSQLARALALSSLLVLKPDDASAEIEILGISASMTFLEIRSNLTDRAFFCDSWADIIWMSDGAISEFLFCTNALSEPLLEEARKLDELFGDLAGHGDSESITGLVSHPEFAGLLIDFNEFANRVYRTTPAVITYKLEGKRTVLFSCAAFSACERSTSEIMQSLASSIDFGAQELLPLEPSILETLSLAVLNTLEDEESPPEELLSYVRGRVLRFQTSASICLFGTEGDRVCLYDGGLHLDAFALPSLVEALFSQPEVLRALVEFQVPTRLVILEELNLNEPNLSFE